MDLDTQVKLKVYALAASEAQMPGSARVAEELGLSKEQVEAAFERLYAKRLLVLEPGDPSRIRMAPPFSGVETGFRVEVSGKSYSANCVWDALGVAAALKQDALIRASDGFSGEPLLITIQNGSPAASPYLAHFAVPAAHWWDNIIYT